MIKNQNGLTLTEALVTGIILAILAVGLLTILILNATETSEGVLNSRLQMQYDNIVEQISRNARFAELILASGEVPGSIVTYTDTAGPIDTILMYDTLLTTPFTGYAISGDGTLQELKAGSWVDYMSGNSTVALTGNSYFKLFPGRKHLEAHLDIASSYKTKSDTLVADTIFISCRN